MSLPYASQSQINAMNKAAEEKFGTESEEVPIPVEADVPQEAEQEEVVEESVEEEPVENTSAQKSQQPSKEDNMRVLRERSEQAERERDALMRKLEDMQRGAQSSHEVREVQKAQEEVDDLSFDPDDLAEGKHLLRLVKKIKSLESKLDNSQKQSNLTATEFKIKRDFPDFEKVASFDNLKKLREHDPDLADAILATPDPYKQYSLAYKMVKQLGIYVEDAHQEDRSRALKNNAKPRPVTSISPQQGDSPLSKANAFANGLTDELKKQLHREMMEAKKNG